MHCFVRMTFKRIERGQRLAKEVTKDLGKATVNANRNGLPSSILEALEVFEMIAVVHFH